MILFDIDFFKAINDGLGHLAGDYTLCELSARVSGIIRREELFARYGGEEFVVALALVSTWLSAVGDVLTVIGSLRDPGPVIARAMTTLLHMSAPAEGSVEVCER